MNRKALNLIVLVFVFATNVEANVIPQSTSGWQVAGQIGGPTQGIAVQGNYAYIGVGTRLVILSITDPDQPTEVGKTKVFSDYVRGVAVQGSYAYVSAGTAGLRVIDITNPSSPSEVGSWTSPGFAENAAVQDNVVYLADGSYGLRLIDVTHPTQPVEIGRAFDMNYAFDVAVDHRYAYLAAAGAGLLIVDISNPYLPVELGAWDSPGYALGVALSGNRVFLADGWEGLQVINASDPLHPALIGSLTTPGQAFDVAVAGSVAYIADADKGLRVVNVSDPAHPAEIGSLEWYKRHAGGVAVSANRVLVADRNMGVHMINAADPSHLVETGDYEMFPYARSIVVSGDYAYITTGFDGMWVIDISDPANPVAISKFDTPGWTHKITMEGQYVYMTNMPPGPDLGLNVIGLHIIDVSDPHHPAEVGFWNGIWEGHGVKVVNHIAYLAEEDGLMIVDVTTPSNPQFLASWDGYICDVEVNGNLAFLGLCWAGMQILDVSNPAQPVLMSSLLSGEDVESITVSGNQAYVSGHFSASQNLLIYDISDPETPLMLGSIGTPSDHADKAAVIGTTVYVADSSRGLDVIDAADPAHPALVEQVRTPGYTWGVAAANGHLYLADGPNGLQILEPGSLAASRSAAWASPQPGPGEVANALDEVTYRERPLLPPSSRPIGATTITKTQSQVVPARSARTCTVTSTADSGPGTLRECLLNQVPGDVINFSTSVFPPSSPATIFVDSELPSLEGNITLDASNAGVVLDGSHITTDWAPGLYIPSDNNIVRGLQIYHFSGQGINVHGQNNVIGGNRNLGNGPTGQGNVVSANHHNGIEMNNDNAWDIPITGNQIIGNLIGTDVTGKVAKGNGRGVSLRGAAQNQIGSSVPGEGNVISGSLGDGIGFYGDRTTENTIEGNLIGTDISGTQALPNNGMGIIIECQANHNLVKGNVISGNRDNGILIYDDTSDYNVVVGNKIGTDISGTQAIPNHGWGGIGIGLAAYNRIGGTAPGEGNLISGNDVGVAIAGNYAELNLVLGNRFGTDITGQFAVGSQHDGIVLFGVTHTIVGGATAAEGNWFAGEVFYGFHSTSDKTIVIGNHFGVAADGISPLTGEWANISIEGGDRNLIQGNQSAFGNMGVELNGAQGNTLRRNSIYGNVFRGIYLSNGANGNLPAPVLSLDAAGGSGTTCAGCTVELFLDANGQGQHYLTSLVADGSGAFHFLKRCPLPYPNLTATATDLLYNTSAFSDPQAVPWDCTTPRPIPTLESVTPSSQQALSATFLLSLFGTEFAADSVVRWDGLALPTTMISSTLLQATVPSHLLRDGGSVLITVFTPPPGGGESIALIFTVYPPKKVYLPLVKR